MRPYVCCCTLLALVALTRAAVPLLDTTTPPPPVAAADGLFDLPPALLLDNDNTPPPAANETTAPEEAPTPVLKTVHTLKRARRTFSKLLNAKDMLCSIEDNLLTTLTCYDVNLASIEFDSDNECDTQTRPFKCYRALTPPPPADEGLEPS